MIDLRLGDCLEIMPGIPDQSVDMVLADPPYGTTNCHWDSVIPFEPMWKELKRIIKPNGAIVMTASQPFTSALVMSNIKWFKYEWVWEKEQGTMPLNAPFQPLKVHESVVIFSMSASTYSKNGSMKYFPQITSGSPYVSNGNKNGKMKFHSDIRIVDKKTNTGTRYPRSVIRLKTERNFHPTQKPVALMEYLIKTYTHENETVLDFCFGSGTTGVACKNLNRHFIGIEKDEKYFKIAENRIRTHTPQAELFLE